MATIPAFVLKKLYVKGSLRAEGDGFALELKNTIAPGTITSFVGIDLDGQAVDRARITLVPPNGKQRAASEVSSQAPLLFPVGATVTLHAGGTPLESGAHELVLRVAVREVGQLDIPISDTVT